MPFRAIAFPDPSRSTTTDPSEQMLLVLLHGWGANAEDVASMAPYLLLREAPSALKMFFPDGPFRHPMPGGRMWYDLPADYTFGSRPDSKPLDGQGLNDLLTSRTMLMEWLQGLESETGIPLSRTILAGFSQGGAMTLDVGTHLPLAGLMILSGYLHEDLSDRPSPLPPILLVHGRQDPVVPIAAAHQSRDHLMELGASLDYHELDMGHDIPLTVLELMQTFMGSLLVSLGKTGGKVL